MSYYDRKLSQEKAPRKPAARTAAEWATAPLSGLQKSKLAIAAKAAWEVQHEAGLAIDDFDVWRHEQVCIACGRAGLRDANQTHYRSIFAHFQMLAGQEAKARETWAKTGRVKGSPEVHDTHENREVARAIIRDLIAGSEGVIGDAYVAAISRNKFAGRELLALTACELKQMVITLRSRLRAKGRHV